MINLPVRFHPADIIRILFLLAALPVHAADINKENDLEAAIGALGGAHLSATLTGLVPDPFTSLVSEGIAYTSNLALKALPSVLKEPQDQFRSPNSADKCSFDFHLPQADHLYSNIYGITLSPVPDNWGALGKPYLFHWGTEVVLGVHNPLIRPNIVPLNEISLPAGQHHIEWRADTIIDLGFDVALPTIMLAMSYSKFKASKMAPAAVSNNADEVLTASQKFKEAGKWMLKKLGVGVEKAANAYLDYVIDENTQWERVSRSKSYDQLFTVYDVLDPVITYQHADQPDGVMLPAVVLEATDFGGVQRRRVIGDLLADVSTYDQCGRTAGLGNNIPDLLPIGTTQVTWEASDLGPTVSGQPNRVQAYQDVVVQDTQGPIMVPPPGRVIEVDPGGPDAAGLADTDVVLGMPRVVDLADPAPRVYSDAPAFFPINSRTPVTWSAVDQSDNESTGAQLITIKALGTNIAPAVSDLQAGTLTSQPVDVVLTGVDNDEIDSVLDPLSLAIVSRPANGDFVAPLLPFFIEDFRTSPAGPFGEAFINSGNQSNWLQDNVCNNPDYFDNPPSTRIPRDWVYKPKFIHVQDDGTYFLIDEYWKCGSSNAQTYNRISKWDRDNQYLGQIEYDGTSNTFVVDDDGFLYIFSRGSSPDRLFITQKYPNLEDALPGESFAGDSWTIRSGSGNNPALGLNDSIDAQSLSYARVDSRNKLLYVTDRRRVFVFDVRADFADGVDQNDDGMADRYLGALHGGEQFLCNRGNWGNSWTGFAMEVDSEGYLYVTDSCDNRIHKFTPSYFNGGGNFVMGQHIGWLGRCETSTNDACDEVNRRSRGYTCTDDTCLVSDTYMNDQDQTVDGSLGKEPGQFNGPVFIDLDPNDVLYVGDAGRVQRFAKDGTFGGQAKSTGTGINQGDRPGFILGNLGTVKAVTVNSTNFFVVDQAESFVHVFETTPLKDITDHSATVTYVSNFNFHDGIDTFTYKASDGLADSNIGTVSVQVDRNFRPPEAFGQTLSMDEDGTLPITLTGDDPDGVIGTDDVYPLDELTFHVVDQPQHGKLSGGGESLVYTPDPDYYGADSFTFVANDGVFDSPPATVDITVNWVDDLPVFTRVQLPARIAAGFPMVMVAEYTDDGNQQEPDHWMQWEAGTWEYPGDFVDPDGPDGPQPAELTGVKLNQPPAGEGTGSMLAKHVYPTTGAKTLTVCIQANPTEVCQDEPVLVEHLVMLDVQVTAESAETTGPYLDIDVSVENMVPDYVAPLTADNVHLSQVTVPELRVQSILSQTGGCTKAGGRLDCADASMAPGESLSATVRVVPVDGTPLIYDVSAPFAVDVSTTSESVENVYSTAQWITFLANKTDSDGDGMSDVFEQTYGLNAESPADAGLDEDGDTLTNLQEFKRRTNPLLADTDGDGVNDAEDFCPLDPGGALEGTNGLCKSDRRLSPAIYLLLLGD